MTNPLTDLIEFCFNHGGSLKSHRSFGELAQIAQRERDEHLDMISSLARSESFNLITVRKKAEEMLAKGGSKLWK